MPVLPVKGTPPSPHSEGQVRQEPDRAGRGFCRTGGGEVEREPVEMLRGSGEASCACSTLTQSRRTPSRSVRTPVTRTWDIWDKGITGAKVGIGW